MKFLNKGKCGIAAGVGKLLLNDHFGCHIEKHSLEIMLV